MNSAKPVDYSDDVSMLILNYNDSYRYVTNHYSEKFKDFLTHFIKHSRDGAYVDQAKKYEDILVSVKLSMQLPNNIFSKRYLIESELLWI